MKRDIKSESEAAGKSFSDVLNIAKTNPICCISAITDGNRNDPDKRSYDTKRLEADIALHYNYIPVLVRWVEPDVGETTEESFIVIGYDYDYKDSDIFKDHLIRLCREYNQCTVLVIDKVYDENTDGTATGDLTQDQTHWVYYDRNGIITDDYYDLNPVQIGNYFTKVFPGSRFTLMADQIVRPGFFSNPSTVWAYEHIMTSDQRISSLDSFKRDDDYLEKAMFFKKKYFG